jgi:RimJ/RimL family protein N-acetyltransferase
LIARYAAEQLGVSRAELHIHPENAASLGVARQAGFDVDGSDEHGLLVAVKELR